MSFLFPLGMAALGALAPLIALYLLKQKRVEVKVPTNFLWARAIEDLRASSLFQRLRTSILLLLQAAAIALFALAAAGASLDLQVGDLPRRLIVLVDRSASMKAADEDGRTRLEVAKDLARELANGLSGADEMMLVGFDVRAEVAASFTADKARLADVIDRLAARDAPTKAADALMLAVSFAQATKGFGAEIVVLSDGCVETELPPITFPVKYYKIGRSGANQGIAGLQVARSPGEPAQVFVRVESGAKEAVERSVTLRRGGEILDARAVQLAADGVATAYFEVAEPEGREPLVLSVGLEGKDALAADDEVTFVLRPAVPRTGLLVAAEPSLWLDPKKIERLHPGLALVTVTPAEAEATFARGDTTIDFVCYDGVEPKTLPPVAGQLYIDALPPSSGLTRGAVQEFPIVIDWDRTHPTTARCQFDDLLVTESMKIGGTGRSRVLLDSTGGPLALLTPVPGREVVVLGFSPGKSNFPLKLSWPLFLANTLDFLLAKTERAGEEPVAPTGTVLSLPADRAAVFVAPSGTKFTEEPDARGRASHSGTWENGLWRVQPSDGPEQIRALALLDATEIRIAPRDRPGGDGSKIVASPRDAQRNLLLRDPLLLAALGLLLLEWALWCSRR